MMANRLQRLRPTHGGVQRLPSGVGCQVGEHGGGLRGDLRAGAVAGEHQAVGLRFRREAFPQGTRAPCVGCNGAVDVDHHRPAPGKDLPVVRDVAFSVSRLIGPRQEADLARRAEQLRL